MKIYSLGDADLTIIYLLLKVNCDEDGGSEVRCGSRENFPLLANSINKCDIHREMCLICFCVTLVCEVKKYELNDENYCAGSARESTEIDDTRESINKCWGKIIKKEKISVIGMKHQERGHKNSLLSTPTECCIINISIRLFRFQKAPLRSTTTKNNERNFSQVALWRVWKSRKKKKLSSAVSGKIAKEFSVITDCEASKEKLFIPPPKPCLQPKDSGSSIINNPKHSISSKCESKWYKKCTLRFRLHWTL